jgi:carboxymethylenebutenolidase
MDLPAIVLAGAPPAAAARYAARGYAVRVAESGLESVRAELAAFASAGIDRVAVAGYGAGGCSAFLAVTRLGAVAGVGFHPFGIGAHLREAALVRVPLSLHFGDADERVPLEEVRAIKGALEGFATTEIYRYPGAGGDFALDGSPGYEAAAAALAEQRALAFLARALAEVV